MEEISLLILGAGWTATFLIPLLQSKKITFAATTTTGRPVADVPTIPFKFDPSAPEDEARSAIASLPRARYILITFPLNDTGPAKLLVEAYTATHLTPTSSSSAAAHTLTPFRFIQLGSSGIWQPGSPYQTTAPNTTNTDPWKTRHSPISTTPRSIAETELLSLGGCVLNLSGLWGGSRSPRNWARRVAHTKELLRGKASLHLIHGLDVARALVAIVEGGEGKWETVGRGQRWMVTDGFVYDWWGMVAGWADGEGGEGEEERARWVWELMREEGIKGLPRSVEVLGRGYDGREFWEALGLVPLEGHAS
ncbi:uncharacterized protein C8A04DRAFT_12338 [Dichotomopilus funicola]|uniref:NAD(P)-binding protein n=1 Tax=Dichotomopilus funicola TaxID=1934379 RepID=A0AAN6ZM10_9PEZI|nr:hypothetical protein C8A04DRAFT_12338 [Dichotomopilus funicola]